MMLCLVTLILLVAPVMTSKVIIIDGDDVMLTIHTRAVQANQASSICRENASELVSIDDAKIQRLIDSRIGEIPIDETDFHDRRLFVGFWTSGRQASETGTWTWWTDDRRQYPDHRRPVLDSEAGWSNFTNWAGYSPVTTSYPSCIYVYPHRQVVYETGSVNVTFNATSGGWLNKPCYMRSYFICEKKISKETATSPPYAAYYVIIPAICVTFSLIIVMGFCLVYRRRARMLKLKTSQSTRLEPSSNGCLRDDHDHRGADDVTNGLTRDTPFNDSWKYDEAAVTSQGAELSHLNNETYESNIHFIQVRRDGADDSDYDEPPDEPEYFERNKLFSTFDENDYDMPPDDVECTHSEFSSDDSYHISDIEAFDSHSQDQGISAPPPPIKEQIYASIESLNKIECSSAVPRRGVHHQQSLHKITNFSHVPLDMSRRKKFPLPHEAHFSNHRATAKSVRSHDTIPEKEFENSFRQT